MVNSYGRLAGKKLLVLDGSRLAIEIVETAQRLGVHVVVTDFNTPEVSPAKLVADEHFDVSTLDVDEIVALIQREGVDGVLPGFSDRLLPTYAEICEKAGVPAYGSVEQMRLFTDKVAYKRLLAEHDVPLIEEFTVEEVLADDVLPGIFPLVVKPADGSGSRGISICTSQAEFAEAINGALAESRTGGLVIERYLPGKEATVHWVFRDGRHHVAVVGNRIMGTLPDGCRLPVGYSYPSALTPEFMRKSAPKLRAALSAAGIRNGIMFMQGLVDEGVFRIYDIGFRPTATLEQRILAELAGYSPMEMLIEFALTGSMGDVPAWKLDPAPKGYGFNLSTLIEPGVVGELMGLAEVAEKEGVLHVAPALVEGDDLPVESWGKLRQIAIRTVGIAETPEEQDKLVQELVQKLDVRDRNGTSLSLPGPKPGEMSEDLM